MQAVIKIKKIATQSQLSIGKAAILLVLTFAISAALGFIRSRLLYAQFFTCCAKDLDVYNAAFRIPDMLFNLLVSGALTSSFIPIFSTYIHQNKQKEAKNLSSSLFGLLLLVFTFISSIIFIFASPITKAITPGFTADQLTLLVSSTRILLIAQVFFLASNFLTGIIQTHQVFLIPSLAPMLYNLSIIFSIIFLAPIIGIKGVIIGATAGAILHFLVQLPVALKLGFRPTLKPILKTPGLKKVLSLMLPRSLSLGLGEIESTIVMFWATTLATGSLSLFRLALQIVYLPSRIFGVSLGQASLPTLSRLISENNMQKFKTTVTDTLLQTTFLALPISIICLVNRIPVVRLAYGSKEFPWSATLDTAQTMAFLVPTIFSQAIIQIINRAFYALHDTKTPLYIAFLSLAVTVFSSFYFVKMTNMGLSGLSFSISMGSVTQLIGLLISFQLQYKYLDIGRLFISNLKLFIASASMGFFVWIAMRSLDIYILDTTKTINVLFVFVGSSVFGLAIYMALLVVLKSGEINWLLHKIKKPRFIP